MTKRELKSIILECLEENGIIVNEKSNYDKALKAGERHLIKAREFEKMDNARAKNKAMDHYRKGEETLRITKDDNRGHFSYVDPEKMRNYKREEGDSAAYKHTAHNNRENWKAQHGNVGERPEDKYKANRYLDIQKKLNSTK